MSRNREEDGERANLVPHQEHQQLGYGSVNAADPQSPSNDGSPHTASEKARIEAQSTAEATRCFLQSSMYNALTFGIWNTLDLAFLITMATTLPSGDVFAGVATAMTITSMTALSVANGMSSALETLIANAYGANRYARAIAKYLQAGTIVNLVLFAPIALLFLLFPYSWLEWAFPHGNEPMLREGMLLWLRFSPLIVLPQLFSIGLQKFAVCQRRPQMVTRSAAVSLVALPALLYVAVVYGEASVLAFALAMTADKFILLTVLVANILFDGYLRSNLWGNGAVYAAERRRRRRMQRLANDAADGADIDADAIQCAIDLDDYEAVRDQTSSGGVRIRFQQHNHNHPNGDGRDNDSDIVLPLLNYIVQYVVVGYPSAIAFCIDTWTFELMTILSARCGPTEAAAWVLMQQLSYPLFALAIGLAAGAAADIGHAHGAQCATRVVVSRVRIAVSSSIIVGIGAGAVLWLLGPLLFRMLVEFSADRTPSSSKSTSGKGHSSSSTYSSDIAAFIGVHCMPLYALLTAVDIPFYTLQGVYRGLNRQTLQAQIVFVSLWVIAVPMAVMWPAEWGSAPPDTTVSSSVVIGGCVYGIIAALLVGAAVGAVLLYMFLERSLEAKLRRDVLLGVTEVDVMSPTAGIAMPPSMFVAIGDATPPTTTAAAARGNSPPPSAGAGAAQNVTSTSAIFPLAAIINAVEANRRGKRSKSNSNGNGFVPLTDNDSMASTGGGGGGGSGGLGGGFGGISFNPIAMEEMAAEIDVKKYDDIDGDTLALNPRRF